MTATCRTYIEANAELVSDENPNQDAYLPGGQHAGDRYTACIYCGSGLLCCGTPGRDDCHCPACHKRDAEEYAGTYYEDDRCDDIPPEADGDTEDPRYSPFARLMAV